MKLSRCGGGDHEADYVMEHYTAFNNAELISDRTSHCTKILKIKRFVDTEASFIKITFLEMVAWFFFRKNWSCGAFRGT